MVLKMCCRQMGRVIHPKTLAIRFHDVTRKAELCTRGVCEFTRRTHSRAKNGQGKQGQKCRDFPR